MKLAVLLSLLLLAIDVRADSTCFGTTSNGRVENTCKLPSGDDNFSVYSHVLRAAGRTYVHCTVAQVFSDAYESLAASHPDSVFVYGETGKKSGVGIWRVLFDPKMQPALRRTKAWPDIASLQFSTKRSWVRHDDHYHVDFMLPCEP